MEDISKNTIDKCCQFIYNRIIKEMLVLSEEIFNKEINDEELLDTEKNGQTIINTTNEYKSKSQIYADKYKKYNNFLFIKFMLILENDLTILNEKSFYLNILKKLFTSFKKLHMYYNVTLYSNDNYYNDFFKDICNIIEDISNKIITIDFYDNISNNNNFEKFFPSNISYKKIYILLSTNIDNHYKNDNNAISTIDIFRLIRFFLLYIIKKIYYYIYFNIINIFHIFLKENFIHYDYITIIKKKKLQVLSDLIKRPNIKKLLNENSFELNKNKEHTYNYININTYSDILNFCKYVIKINEKFETYSEFMKTEYSLLYFFLFYTYKNYNFYNFNNENNYLFFIKNFVQKVIVPDILIYKTFDHNNKILIKKIISFENIDDKFMLIFCNELLNELSKIIDDEVINDINNEAIYYFLLKEKYDNFLYILNILPLDINAKILLITKTRDLLVIINDNIKRIFK